MMWKSGLEIRSRCGCLGSYIEAIAEHIGDITEDGVKYNLKRLQSIGLLRRIGPDFGGCWEVL